VYLCVAPFPLCAWADQYIPSRLSSIYNATTHQQRRAFLRMNG
jgi:hypothetical protein